MNITIFNTSLAIGWLMVVAGLSTWSWPLALVVGGGLLLLLTMVIAKWVGLAANREG